VVRLAAFFAAALAIVGALMWLNWWVDPLGDVYDGSAVARALDRSRPCLVSDDVVGVNSWWAFKRDVYRRHEARTIVIGTSRVLQMDAYPREWSFGNLGLPGTGAPTLVPYFRDLHAIHPGPLTVYLGIELFWLNANWAPPYFYVPPGRSVSLRKLLTRQRLGGTISQLVDDPSVLFRRWHVIHVAGRCVVDVGNNAATGKVQSWEPDGSVAYPWEVNPAIAKPPVNDDFDRDLGNLAGPQYLGGYYTNWHALGHLKELGDGLALTKRYGWRVVGFVPPYSPRYVERLTTAPQTVPRWRDFGRVVPALFVHYGGRFVDTRRVRSIPCPDDAFIDDGWHPNRACAARVRRLLDEAARRPAGAYVLRPSSRAGSLSSLVRVRVTAH
jgi:hypothetical protein